jgi:hypothetical protein
METASWPHKALSSTHSETRETRSRVYVLLFHWIVGDDRLAKLIAAATAGEAPLMSRVSCRLLSHNDNAVHGKTSSLNVDRSSANVAWNRWTARCAVPTLYNNPGASRLLLFSPTAHFARRECYTCNGANERRNCMSILLSEHTATRLGALFTHSNAIVECTLCVAI